MKFVLTLKHFDQAQIRTFVREVREKWGQMWDLCGPEVRKAFIDQYVVTLVLTLGGHNVDKAVLREARNAMMLEAGLVEPFDGGG